MERIILVVIMCFVLVGCGALLSVLSSPVALDVEAVVVQDAEKEVEALRAEQPSPIPCSK